MLKYFVTLYFFCIFELYREFSQSLFKSIVMIYIHTKGGKITINSSFNVTELIIGRKTEKLEVRVNPHDSWLREVKGFFDYFTLMVGTSPTNLKSLVFYKGKIEHIKYAKVVERYPICLYKRREEEFFSNINLHPRRRVEYMKEQRGGSFRFTSTDTKLLKRWGLYIMVSDYSYNTNTPIRLAFWSTNEIKIKNEIKGTVSRLAKSVVI